jgi:CRISPR/Cas system-associated exonuclease Cas4 (RecB family)
MDKWRDPFVGITHLHSVTSLMISGGFDDIWVKPKGDLKIVYYKSTSKEGIITTLGYSPWEKQYSRQLGVYAWLLEKNGFTVDATGYLVYANADKSCDTFSDTLVFETTLVPVEADTSWIEHTLTEIKSCLEGTELPAIGSACEFCPYREASGKKLQAVHFANKK